MALIHRRFIDHYDWKSEFLKHWKLRRLTLQRYSTKPSTVRLQSLGFSLFSHGWLDVVLGADPFVGISVAVVSPKISNVFREVIGKFHIFSLLLILIYYSVFGMNWK